MADRTTIPVSKDTHEQLQNAKPDGVSWDRFTLTLLNAHREDGGGEIYDVRLTEEQYHGLVADIAEAAGKKAADNLFDQLERSGFR